jgi:hypothetical protein
LGSLGLSSNQLSGSIPPELGNLDNLVSLNLNSNHLSGSIPPELGNLSNLVGLGLSSNQLSGNIPAELGNFSNLGYLGLARNQLSGSIPPELGNLSMLRQSYLPSNLTYFFPPPPPPPLSSDIGYNCLYTNDDTLRSFLNDKDQDWEDTQTIAPANVFAAGITTSLIRVSWTPITYSGDTGGYKVYYSTTSGGPWTYAGMTADKFALSYGVTGLYPGTKYYFVVKTQTDAHSNNTNTVFSEYSEEVSGPVEDKELPFGSFSTPIDGSTAASSIPVTGWALDDTGIDSVKIYREQDSSLIYIGDATLVEGARPDVAAAYHGYPNNTRAGWGYMMLTNFFPNSGNGTFIIHAIATDLAGKSTTLGTKTIICDNANAVKPFGALDTPTQGGTASGSGFVNWGWVLTPQPNSIPIDGSTINVWVDGVNIGNPIYNNFRSDIASLFPGYANSNGAIGFFNLDTTAYANGVHTIQWTARDSAGNSDGIGSRYFSIQNTGGASASSTAGAASSIRKNPVTGIDALKDVPVDHSTPVSIRKGFVKDIEPVEIYPDNKGLLTIKIKELERVELDFSNSNPDFSQISGYMVVGDQLFPLPVGSTLAAGERKFYWQPGAGFIGEYRFVFIEKEQGMTKSRKDIIVKIVPKFE